MPVGIDPELEAVLAGLERRIAALEVKTDPEARLDQALEGGRRMLLDQGWVEYEPWRLKSQ